MSVALRIPEAGESIIEVRIVAVMRKLVGLLDTLLREDRLGQPMPPTRELEVAA